MTQQKIILIAGPTASGKSALALKLAHENKGTIINADAMQIYSGLPVLSAQPSAEQLKTVPHELYGILDPSQRSSAGTWMQLAKTAITKTLTQNRTPLLTGGTGLYFKSLMGGLADIPEIPKEVRHKVQEMYDTLGEEKFRKELSKLDPESAARLAKNDRQRSIRSYEVALHTGKPIGYWQKKTKPGFLDDFKIERHLLLPPRDELYAACDKRFDLMIKMGAVAEAKHFLARRLDPTLPAMKTLGLREIGAHLKGEINLKEAVIKAQQATRNYAKRQMTWFRNQWKA
ncbi:MAG: tRNA (adenosine(37)-N6)-dimethylallyltransferase MiaA [Alphaproteobacteria bacterium]